MSAEETLTFTKRLEPALRALAANSDEQVSTIASKHGVDAKDMWTWLGQHNGGKKVLPAHRIDAVLAKLHEVPASANNRQIGQIARRRGGRDKLPEATSPAAKEAATHVTEPRPARTVPAPAPKPVRDSAPNTSRMPWEGRKAPFRKTYNPVRPLLVQIAAGEVNGTKPGTREATFCAKWFRTSQPTAAMASAFVAWVDSERPAATVKVDVLEAGKRPAAVKRAKAAPAAAPIVSKRFDRIAALRRELADFQKDVQSDAGALLDVAAATMKLCDALDVVAQREGGVS